MVKSSAGEAAFDVRTSWLPTSEPSGGDGGSGGRARVSARSRQVAAGRPRRSIRNRCLTDRSS